MPDAKGPPMPMNRIPAGAFALACAVTAVLAACGTVSIKSSPPEAEVYVLVPGKERSKPLGKTPYEARLKDLDGIANQGTIVVQVEKKGFLPQQFVVPNLSGGRLSIDTTLTPIPRSDFQEIQKIISLVLRAEREILQKQFKEALATAGEIKKLNENIASAFEVEGTVHLMTGKKDAAKIAWARVLELDPNNADAKRIMTQLAGGKSATADGKPAAGAKPAN